MNTKRIMFIDFKDGGAELIKKGNKYEFILEYQRYRYRNIFIYK